MKDIYSGESFIVSDDISDRVDMSSIIEEEKRVDQFFCILDLGDEKIKSLLESVTYTQESTGTDEYRIDLNMKSPDVEKIFNREKTIKLTIKNNDNLLVDLSNRAKIKSIKLTPRTKGFHSVSLTISDCGS